MRGEGGKGKNKEKRDGNGIEDKKDRGIIKKDYSGLQSRRRKKYQE